MLVGYAQVCIAEQNPDHHTDALLRRCRRPPWFTAASELLTPAAGMG